MALLDAWAMVADVLAFYQERIATELYLRTATERRSIIELARAIGYELNPGVAASTYLAFTLEDALGSPKEAIIDKGTRAQSIPGPGEKPQTYETIERIEAKAEYNVLKPRQTALQLPGFGSRHIYLEGIATNLKPGRSSACSWAWRERSKKAPKASAGISGASPRSSLMRRLTRRS